MDWPLFLLIFIASAAVLLLARVPVAIVLLLVSFGGYAYFGDVEGATRQTTQSILNGLTSFTLAPVPLFILLGELLFRYGIAQQTVSALNQSLRALPGRLAIVATGSGAVLGTVSGSAMASTAVLTASLVPEMRRHGYDDRLAMGSVLASGGLASVIPPSTLAVIWGATAGVPVGPLLVAGLLPGLVMAGGYIGVSAVWARFLGGTPADQTKARSGARLAGSHGGSDAANTAPPVPYGPLEGLVRYVLPLGLLVFLVIGLIILGVATPSESAATGVAGALVLGVAYRAFTWGRTWQALQRAGQTTGMVLLLVAGADVFSRVMARSGATRGIIEILTGFADSPLSVLLVMLGITILLGLFLEQIATILVTLPFFMPLVAEFGIDPIWFGILMLVALQIGLTTPPFGMSLFVVKGLMPRGTPLKRVYVGAIPYVAWDVIVLAILIAVPSIVLLIPGAMG